MKRILLPLAFIAAWVSCAYGQSTPPWTITEADGSPRVTSPNVITVTNGSLTCTGRNCTLVTGGGGGGGTPGGSNTQVQYNNAGSFGGAAGFTFNGTAKITLGVAGTSVGSIGFNNATSGQVTLQPVTGALGTVTLSLPARTATVATTTGTLTSGRLAEFDASGNLVQSSITATTYAPGGTTNSIQINNGGGAFDGGANAVVDLLTSTLSLGTSSSQAGKLQLRNPTNANTTTIQPGAPSVALTFTLPATLPASAGCLEVSSTGVITQTGSACGSGGGGANTALSNLSAVAISDGDGTANLATGAGINMALAATAPAATTGASQAGKTVTVTASNAVASTDTSGAAAGGGITFTTGNAARLTSGDARGGDFEFVNGTSVGTNSTTALGQIILPCQGRYDNPSLTFRTSGFGVLRQYGFGFDCGGNSLSLGAPQTLNVSVGDANQGFSVGYVLMNNRTFLSWVSGNSNPSDFSGDTFFGRRTTASLQLGLQDAATPVAQTLTVQGVVAGTSNTAGANFTIAGSIGTGTGVGGSLIFQTAPAGSSGSSQNALVTAMTIPTTGGVVFPEVGSAPATPSANNAQLYVRDKAGVSNLYWKNDAGTEFDLSTTGGGSGTVTSVSFTGGLISVATATTTPALTVAGTSGGIPYFSSASTWASSAALTANLPVIGGGAGAAPTVGTVSGNTTKFVTTTGTLTSGRCAEWDASGNLIESSGACGGGGGSPGGSSGDVQINNAGSFGGSNLNYSSPTFTQTTTALNSTATDGLVLQNTTAATNTQNQYSQAIRWTTQGWRTTATAASRTVDWRVDLRPLDGTTNPANRLVYSSQVNAGGYTERIVFGIEQGGTAYASFPGGGETGWPGMTWGANFGSQASPNINGIYADPGGSLLIMRPANRFATHGSGFGMLSGATLSWSNNASSIPTGTNDLFLSRSAAAVLQQGAANAASPVNQTLQAQGSRSGTDSNVAGAGYTIQSGNGTGNATPSTLILRSPVAVASGTTAQTMTTGLTINQGTAQLTAYTVANLPSASGVGQGAMAFVTDATSTTTYTTVAGGGSNKVMVISDGTNWIIH